MLTIWRKAEAGLNFGEEAHFPWQKLYEILQRQKYTLYNWPDGCPFPGTETDREGNKKSRGMGGLKQNEQMALFGALAEGAEHPLEFRKFDEPGESPRLTHHRNPNNH